MSSRPTRFRGGGGPAHGSPAGDTAGFSPVPAEGWAALPAISQCGLASQQSTDGHRRLASGVSDVFDIRGAVLISGSARCGLDCACVYCVLSIYRFAVAIDILFQYCIEYPSPKFY